MSEKGLVFDIQGFSVHDGPGCRTLIFLKGCTLNCGWCANPEGIVPNSQVLYVISKSDNEAVIRNDPAWEMKTFKEIRLTNKSQLSSYPFYLYRFEK